MIDISWWRARYPEAAAALDDVHREAMSAPPKIAGPMSEAWVQQQVRMRVAYAGGLTWRNNVGALKDERGIPVRYGLANDSAALNKQYKSSDLIGVLPVTITRDMVGQTIGQFLALECKAAKWRFTGNAHELAQSNWLNLITAKGGRAQFTNGEVDV